MKYYATADWHGNYVAAMNAINNSPFNPEKDMLIHLGDVVDGHDKGKQCIEYLVNLPYKIIIRGNHDSSTEGAGKVKYGWFLGWALTGFELPLWYHQGGIWTIASYDNDYRNVPQSHKDLLMNAVPYYKFQDMIFVHGGFDERIPIEDQDPEDIMWNRDLVYHAHKSPVPGYKKIFVGHTCTAAIMKDRLFHFPLFLNNVIALDTNAGYNGPVTIMNIKTLEYWQS